MRILMTGLIPSLFMGLAIKPKTQIIALGKLADTVILEDDPTHDITNTRRIAYVIKRA